MQVLTNRPFLSDPFHSLCSLLLILLLLHALLGRVPLNALCDCLVVLGDVVQEPAQAVLDGLVDLLTVAQDCRARFLTTQTACIPVLFFFNIIFFFFKHKLKLSSCFRSQIQKNNQKSNSTYSAHL